MILRIPENVPPWSLDWSFVMSPPRDPNDDDDDDAEDGDDAEPDDDQPATIREPDE